MINKIDILHKYTPLIKTKIRWHKKYRSTWKSEGGSVVTFIHNMPQGSLKKRHLEENNPQPGHDETSASGSAEHVIAGRSGKSSEQSFSSVEMPAPAFEGNVRSAAEEASGYDHRLSFPGNHARETELERLRKIEENYEKDKAMLARQKQPALARSESHDIGHAGGDSEISLSVREENKMFNDFLGFVKENLRH